MSNRHILAFLRESRSDESLVEVLDNALCYPTVPTSTDALSEAQHVRRLLIDKGFCYTSDFFLAHDVIRGRRGNCLGYSLLIGGLLLDRGFDVSFQVITHPKDAVHRQDMRLFNELYRGEHFSYDNPKLPRLRDVSSYRACRFAPLEHPSLLLDGKSFEVTSLEDEEEDPNWIPEAELVRRASFDQVLSFVGIDTAQCMFEEDEPNMATARDLVRSSLELWPGNREGWLVLWRIAVLLDDESLKGEAETRYQNLGGDDSRFYQGMYELTHDSSFLTLSLERFPANIVPFTLKHVELEVDQREAKFNLAVAACCVLNSSVLDLKRFYLRHEESVRRLFGDRTWKGLLS